MRKIMTKEERERKSSRNKIILGMILVGIMIMSTAGYSFFSNPSTTENDEVDYKGTQFARQNNGIWAFEAGGYTFYTSYNPYDTENISVTINSLELQNYVARPVYYSGDTRIMGEIYGNFQYFSQRIQEVCIEGENCTKDLPVKNCNESVILIRLNDNKEETTEEGGNGKVYSQNKCTVLSANSYEELLKTADAFLFRIFNIN